MQTKSEDGVAGVPLLSDIPWLGELFKNRSSQDQVETLFVFIRPIMLREPNFEHLISLSQADMRAARLSEHSRPRNTFKRFEMSPDYPQEGASK